MKQKIIHDVDSEIFSVNLDLSNCMKVGSWNVVARKPTSFGLGCLGEGKKREGSRSGNRKGPVYPGVISYV